MSDIPENRRRACGAGDGMMDPNNQIASKLRALYSAVEREPIPDLFLDLLERLDKAEQTGKSRR